MENQHFSWENPLRMGQKKHLGSAADLWVEGLSKDQLWRLQHGNDVDAQRAHGDQRLAPYGGVGGGGFHRTLGFTWKTMVMWKTIGKP